MTDMILVYITCTSREEAQKIGKHLLEKRLCACINIVDGMKSLYWWPPKEGKLEEGNETILIVKTLEEKFDAVEADVVKMHSYSNPAIIAIPTAKVTKKYYEWIKGEIE